MKKKLIVLFMICLILFSLVGCGKSYQEATNSNESGIGEGYFTTVKKWGASGLNYSYYIVYANDTKVMYFIMANNRYISGITPLYNADGTLQIYGE